MVDRAAHEQLPADDVLARVHREEHSRLLATLVRRFGDLDLAEDAAQEAMESALRSWPEQGVPQRPLAWLTTVAKRVALDRVRRDATVARRLAQLHVREGPVAAPPADEEALAAEDLPDDRLAMLMGCCHPAIAPADRIALMLRFVASLSTAEVAQSLLLPVPTLQARITRAKKRITATAIPLTVPADPAERDRRLPLVLTAISLIFTEGYAATSGDTPIRRELTAEAIRLARITHHLLPSTAEPQGLLALLLLTDARSPAREDSDGVPVPLEDQDRSRWDRLLLQEGLALVQEAAGRKDAGRLTIQATIAAVHAEADRFEETDWEQIVVLYDLLLARGEDPVVRMNRAIAVGRAREPTDALALLEQLAEHPELARHHPFHIAHALFCEKVERFDDAVAAWRRALELVDNSAERRFIERRLDAATTTASGDP
ncbi:RNA polymerase sigma factor [Brachybacterium sp. FME24]|uniref:RNA polymerase sigma factor n=1 Tax=Brachybacterium sp. FME24 TaxID=2742605 RepID=UPI0018696C7D|nr:sigma-70 family RNA polymerase sigma factor [Brachybacterium sp. FME24]